MRRLGATLVVLVGLGLLVIVTLVVSGKLYSVPASSMEPTLRCARPNPGCSAGTGDRVFVLRFWGPVEPERGDLVAFRTPALAFERCGAGGTFLKRLVGLPGETVVARGERLLVDGRPLDEPYARPGTEEGSWRLGPDQFFLVGDNRPMSCDSRVWGPVPRENLIGEVAAVYWPPDRIGFR
jgi:signal peptidase I